MAFAGNIKGYTKKMLEALKPEELYRLYQLLDDLAHMAAGGKLPPPFQFKLKAASANELRQH